MSVLRGEIPACGIRTLGDRVIQRLGRDPGRAGPREGGCERRTPVGAGHARP